MRFMNLETKWPIEQPLNFSLLQGGVNNQIWKVEMAEGQSYVLRLIPDSNDLDHIRYEAAILDALSRKSLPFLFPVPMRTREGDIFAPVEQENAEEVFAVLTPLLAGSLHDRNTSIIAISAAVTLAQLDTALATLPVNELPESASSLATFGELAQCHPLVANPLGAVEKLPIDTGQVAQTRSFLASVMESVPDLYRRLPQQLVHRDYDPSNILVDGLRVTAVLDFEFAGVDLRVLDLCVALSWWPVNLMGTGKEWEIIDAFGGTYCAHFLLSNEELLAIPDVFRLRDAASLVYRMGRYLAGRETDERMQNRVQHSLWREAWLAANRNMLVEHLLEYGRNGV